jgi:hypothetical protein
MRLSFFPSFGEFRGNRLGPPFVAAKPATQLVEEASRYGSTRELGRAAAGAVS